MCGIAGVINYNSNLTKEMYIIENMTDTLKKRGPDSYGFYTSQNVLLGHRRLIVVDPSGGDQPMTKTYNNNKYIIVYNGELYNTENVREELLDFGFSFNSYSDTEVLLTSYIAWGPDCVHHINGIFAFGIWDEKENRLFLCRDHLGVKPLYYTVKDNNFIFGSELKTLLAHPSVEPIIDEEGICEIFGLGPAHSLNSGIFKDIYALPPANFILYSKDGLKVQKYWDVKCEHHDEDIDTTSEHVRELLTDAIKRQLFADVPVCTFLSGGLDSSIISAIAASYFRERNSILETYSIDYKDNDRFFVKNDFQPDSDDPWIDKMSTYINSNHKKIIIDSLSLSKALIDAVKSNDAPGMADIDSSLYLFCNEVRKNATVALSGECADEVFGGYPWFRRPELINSTTFPWSRSVDARKSLLSSDFKNINLEEYVQSKYMDTIKKTPKLDGESKFESRMREISYLNMKWFMVTLLTRKDKMSMGNSLEVRVPFADYKLVEYAYNIPIEMKFYNGREKGLLRNAMKDILPDDVLWRVKSPYPKTFNPEYTDLVQNWLSEILEDKTSPILQLIDYNKVRKLVETRGESFNGYLFGQLMKAPQLMAYLIQINIWLNEYKVRIKIQ
ncbi:asparagine synthase (glutamine-hydrolyzing) [Clostridium bovifaecis]|uniref:asparagine synthase (glutamine-hydrolyzing) n=1 Tax=Clostridium bovifaecis TaxID=2184719 RepID=A0A6I6EYE4_9CLOT|nr:asparagine synthase (glutamine-hydrolyzing) [Clostridium bovifaecis]